jgi:hypothetical protein
MFKFILLAYLDVGDFLAKRPLIVLFLFLAALINVPLSVGAAKLGPLDLFVIWTLEVLLFGLIFRADGVTNLTALEWFKKYYLRTLLQIIIGLIIIFPFYMVSRMIFGEDMLVLQPARFIFGAVLNIWVFVSIQIGSLWLCFRDEGLLQNIKNAINDVFRNFRYYLIFQLVVLVLRFLSGIVLEGFVTFNGLACGLSVLISILIFVSLMAIIFGFLRLRKRESQIADNQPLPTEN